MRKTPSDWQIEHQEGVTIFDGAYKGPEGFRLRGRIIEYASSPLSVYAYDIPTELRKHHPHGYCWQLWRPGEKWFYLHWAKPAWDFESGKEYVEKMMWEVYAK